MSYDVACKGTSAVSLSPSRSECLPSNQSRSEASRWASVVQGVYAMRGQWGEGGWGVSVLWFEGFGLEKCPKKCKHV